MRIRELGTTMAKVGEGIRLMRNKEKLIGAGKLMKELVHMLKNAHPNDIEGPI